MYCIGWFPRGWTKHTMDMGESFKHARDQREHLFKVCQSVLVNMWVPRANPWPISSIWAIYTCRGCVLHLCTSFASGEPSEERLRRLENEGETHVPIFPVIPPDYISTSVHITVYPRSRGRFWVLLLVFPRCPTHIPSVLRDLPYKHTYGPLNRFYLFIETVYIYKDARMRGYLSESLPDRRLPPSDTQVLLREVFRFSSIDSLS